MRWWVQCVDISSVASVVLKCDPLISCGWPGHCSCAPPDSWQWRPSLGSSLLHPPPRLLWTLWTVTTQWTSHPSSLWLDYYYYEPCSRYHVYLVDMNCVVICSVFSFSCNIGDYQQYLHLKWRGFMFVARAWVESSSKWPSARAWTDQCNVLSVCFCRVRLKTSTQHYSYI